jgi:hypothetical protein
VRRAIPAPDFRFDLRRRPDYKNAQEYAGSSGLWLSGAKPEHDPKFPNEQSPRLIAND